jgi:hypothetical protein
MKIAVITPTVSDREALLEECKASVRRQETSLPFEHFVEDDVSRTGCGLTRNRIVASLDPSFGWLAFLDDDDLMMPCHLQVLASESDEADILYSDVETSGWEKTWTTGPFDVSRLYVRNYIPVTVLMRRSVFERARGFSKVFAEDWDLWKRCAVMGARFKYVPQLTWIYRRAPGQTSMLETGRISFEGTE